MSGSQSTEALEEASDGSDNDADEINQKVARVMAPLLKKLQRQAKKISALEEALTRQTRDATARLEPLERGLAAQQRSVDDEFKKINTELAGRAQHKELARVEALARDAESSLRSTLDEARCKLGANELLLHSLQARLAEAEDAGRRLSAALDERTGSLRASAEQHAASAEARRAELQLQVSEVQVKLQGELGALRLSTQLAHEQLDERVGASARRAELDERLGALQQAHDGLVARVDRQAAQLTAQQQQLAELQRAVTSRASLAEVEAVRAAVGDGAERHAAAARELLEAAVQTGLARDARAEARRRALETHLAVAQRELRQLAANLEALGAAVGERALAAELAPLREAVGALDGLARRESVRALEERLDALPPAAPLDELRRAAQAAADGAQVAAETATALLAMKADAEPVRQLHEEVRRLAHALEGKLGADEARALLGQKAERGALQQHAQGAEHAAQLALATRARLDAAEGALAQAAREAGAAVEQSRATQAALVQLQAAGERHWQATRTHRDEHAQLVRAVRALLMDAELRVATEEGAEHPRAAAALELGLEQYGQHGWTAAGGKAPRSGGRRAHGHEPLPPSPPSPLADGGTDGPNGVLSRRRRMLARSALVEPPPTLDVMASAPPVACAVKPTALSSAGGRARIAHDLNWSRLGPYP